MTENIFMKKKLLLALDLPSFPLFLLSCSLNEKLIRHGHSLHLYHYHHGTTTLFLLFFERLFELFSQKRNSKRRKKEKVRLVKMFTGSVG